ncbi:right-handed parallel beta-helix repeat-containing protein [Baaleninema sp.]|uniref:right-handed parallel beta-helix repeat-containing protein n=1 Tax=Baaleninema sp. TaxID=3101197 RepID=UPI003D05697D
MAEMGLNVTLDENDNEFAATNANDTVFGLGGNDTLYGLFGDDVLSGDDGDDLAFGGGNNDAMSGGNGNDFLFGEDGDDAIGGNDGDDTLFGGLGNDFLSGNTGNDQLFGETGNDQLFGGADNDFLYGGLGDDILRGETGDDTLDSTAGNSVLAGGEGNDILHGRTGRDTLFGGVGDDSINGGVQDDLIYGEDGNDLLGGSQGNDIIFAGLGDDTVFAGKGDDQVNGSEGNDFIFGDIGADLLTGNNGSDTISGNAGADAIFGGAEADILVGGQEDDTLSGDNGDDIVNGDAGNDVIFGGEDNDSLSGGEGEDVIAGNTGDDTLFGGDGDDTLFGGKGNDRILGEGGNDTVSGGAGADIFALIAEEGSADTVLDFNTAEGDKLLLGGGLRFDDIDIEQGNGLNVNDTIIRRSNSDVVLVVLKGVPASNITEETFSPNIDIPIDDGGDDGGDDDTNDDANLTATPKLRGAELLVADLAGDIGQVAALDATSFTVTTVETDNGDTVENAITIDSNGNISLTDTGESTLNDADVEYIDVSISTDTDNSGTVRIYGSIADALQDDEIGNNDDVSVGDAQDTIRIAIGTYEDSFEISQSVTLLGANAGLAGNDDGRGDEASITATVEISSADVTLDGLEFTADLNADNTGDNLVVQNSVFSGAGLSVQPSQTRTGVQISDNQFTNVEGTAIDLQNLENATVSNNDIDINDASASSDGIAAEDITGISISNNTIAVPADGGSGIQVTGSTDTATPASDITISGNTIEGEGDAGTADTDGGITLRDGNFTNLRLTDNTVSGFSGANTTGSLLFVRGTEVPDPEELTITDNILAADDPGFSVYSNTAAGEASSIILSNNFSESGVALAQDNVASAGNTDFVLA